MRYGDWHGRLIHTCGYDAGLVRNTYDDHLWRWPRVCPACGGALKWKTKVARFVYDYIWWQPWTWFRKHLQFLTQWRIQRHG